MDCRREHWDTALGHLNRSLRFNTDNLRARNLKALVLRKLHRVAEADALVRETLALDPLDWWARTLRGDKPECDLQVRLDLAHDLARAGLYREASSLLRTPGPKRRDLPDQNWGAEPMVHYTLAWLRERRGDKAGARAGFERAAATAPDYCFPARLEDIAVLEAAMRANPKDARAPYYLGNLFYDRRRHAEAIGLWERSVKLDPRYSVAWRNLGIGYFNVAGKPARARMAYERAVRANPEDARLFYERDQLWKRLGVAPSKRLGAMEKRLDLVRGRDDLSVELCALYNQTHRPEKALEVLSSRRFQPWEGGEGQALGQHARAHLALGRAAMGRGDYRGGQEHFEAALASPENLAEAKHLLANQSDIHYELGLARAARGDAAAARRHWEIAANFKGDFQDMSVRVFSEMTYYSALSLERLGKKIKADRLLHDLLTYARKLRTQPARIDYFATSLPTMLLFEDDLPARQETRALFLQAQARLGLGHAAAARSLLARVLRRDPNHALAEDLLAEPISGLRRAAPKQRAGTDNRRSRLNGKLP